MSVADFCGTVLYRHVFRTVKDCACGRSFLSCNLNLVTAVGIIYLKLSHAE